MGKIIENNKFNENGLIFNVDEIIKKSIQDVIKATRITNPNHPFCLDDNANAFYMNNFNRQLILFKILIENLILNNRNRQKILDIGPAEGIIPRAFKKLGHDVYVLEHTKCSPNLDKIRYYESLKLKECVIEKEEFPYDDNYFDIVTNFGVIEHIEPPTNNFWEEIYRVTKKKGLVFIDNPNPLNIRKRIYMFFGINPNNQIEDWYGQNPIFTGHLREHTIDEMVYCAKKTGFEVLKKSGVNLIMRGYLDIEKFLIKKLIIKLSEKLSLTKNMKDTIYILCQK